MEMLRETKTTMEQSGGKITYDAAGTRLTSRVWPRVHSYVPFTQRHTTHLEM